MGHWRWCIQTKHVCVFLYMHTCVRVHVCMFTCVCMFDLMYMHGSVCKACVYSFICFVSTSHHLDLSVVCGGHVESPQTSSAKPETDPEALEVGTRMFLYLHPDTHTKNEKSTVQSYKKQDVVLMRS